MEYENRKTLPRNKCGQVPEVEGLDEFTRKVAKELLDQFKNVDYMDLELIFNKQFAFAYVRERMYRNAKSVNIEKEKKERKDDCIYNKSNYSL